jgi:hypothetical protein
MNEKYKNISQLAKDISHALFICHLRDIKGATGLEL